VAVDKLESRLLQTNYIQDAPEGLIRRSGLGYDCPVSAMAEGLRGMLAAEIVALGSKALSNSPRTERHCSSGT
jgi:hypothetical protein